MQVLIDHLIIALLLISLPASIVAELLGYHIPLLDPLVIMAVIIILLLYRFFVYLNVIRKLDWEINLFYWKFLETLRKSKIAKRIKYEMKQGNFILLCSLGCGLGDYQHELSVLTREHHIKKLCWTNIYPPREVVGKEQSKAYRCKDVENTKGKPEEKGKFKICILSPLNIKEWREDSGNKALFKSFIEEATDNEGKLYFISESSLRELEKGTHKEAKIGDYAVFNDSLLLSFNPTTSDLKGGDFYLSTGDISAFTNIFRLIEERPGAFKEKFDEAIEQCKQDYKGKISDAAYNYIFT